jgi:hypothetical protein
MVQSTSFVSIAFYSMDQEAKLILVTIKLLPDTKDKKRERGRKKAQIHFKQFTHQEAANIMTKNFAINTVG